MADFLEELNETNDSELPYVLFYLGDVIYAISSQYVLSIETLKEVTSVVGSPSHVRGGLIFDDEFINLIDLRKLFGLEGQIDEFINSINPNQRVHDHENWINELERCVVEEREFKLTDDPRQCAFGKWFYSFSSNNHVLNHHIGKIEKPHSEVHNTAKIVKQLMRENKKEQALSVINDIKNTHYKETINILSSLHEAIAENTKELFIIINNGDKNIGIIVDSISSIESLDEVFPLPKTVENRRYIKFISRCKESKLPVLVLDISMIS